MNKLAIITTHPIQYNAPWFRLLAQRKNIKIKVFYTWSQVAREEKYDPGFGKNIAWDIPLLEGYEYTFIENISKNPGSKSYSGIDNPALIQEVTAWQPDAVLVFGWKFKSHLKLMKHFSKKIPVLFRGDSTTLDDRPNLKTWLKYLFLKRIYSNISYALFTGFENERYFQRSGLKSRQLIRVPHAVDNKRFNSEVIEKKFRQVLNISEEEIVFLFAGKLELKKNPGLLASVFREAGLLNTHLVFVGNGPMEIELKSEYVFPNIHFIDFQNQQLMPEVYKMADVFVLPSQGPGETWGLAVNEAMASGKAVLVSDKCGCAVDLVEAGVTGFTFESNNTADLQKKIELMAADKAKLKEMGRNACKKIQDWSFEKIITAVEDVVIASGVRR